MLNLHKNHCKATVAELVILRSCVVQQACSESDKYMYRWMHSKSNYCIHTTRGLLKKMPGQLSIFKQNSHCALFFRFSFVAGKPGRIRAAHCQVEKSTLVRHVQKIIWSKSLEKFFFNGGPMRKLDVKGCRLSKNINFGLVFPWGVT